MKEYTSFYWHTFTGRVENLYPALLVSRSHDGNIRYAWLLKNEDRTPLRLAWQDEDRGLTFTLTANNLTSRELTNAAQGIYLN